MSRFKVLAVCLAVPLAACSSRDTSDWSLVYKMATDYWNGTPPVSLHDAAAIPYASIGVQIGDGPQVLFVLATDSGSQLMWVAGRSTAVVTRDGRIVRTSGLEHDLTGYIVGSMPANGESTVEAWQTPGTIAWTMDFADLSRFSVRVTCTRDPAVLETISLLEKDIHVLHVNERCSAPLLSWDFTDSFWVDPSSGFVWRSIQHIRPDMDPIRIDVLRPPG